MMPHGELGGRLGGELGFPVPTIKIVASQPETGRQSITTQDVTVFASRKLSWVSSSICDGSMNCSVLMGFGRREGLEVSGFLIGCHVFCLN